MENKQKKLEEIVRKSFNSADDTHVAMIFDRLLEMDVIDELEEDWDDGGKYSLGTLIYQVEYEGEQFVLSCSQSRSGSWHTDYYYNEPTLDSIHTLEEYHSPKTVFSFNFKGSEVNILNNKSVKVNDKIFNDVEGAIDSILTIKKDRSLER